MRATKLSTCPILFFLLLGVAAAQKDAPTNVAATMSQPAGGASENSSSSQKRTVSSNAAITGGSQPAAPSAGKTSSSSDAAHSTAPSDDPVLADPRPAPSHAPLPVVINSSSPSLDRSIPRQYVPPLSDDFVIGEEDVITVTIWKEHDLSGSVVVRPDGKITVPLVGEVKVVGMKPLQLETLLEDQLKPFITVPKVSISVNQINSRKVYLIGQVVKEGTFPINSSMTVLQVLSAAGGLRDFAKRKKIYILRKRGDSEIRFPFDYDAAIRGRNREENIRVEPGDTIVVP